MLRCYSWLTGTNDELPPLTSLGGSLGVMCSPAMLRLTGEGRATSSVTELPADLYNDLQCPICLEFFRHPVILPCSHVLCRSPCAENLFDFNFIRCPVCRENCYISGGIGSLPRVIALESIIDKYRAERRKVLQNASKGQKQSERSQDESDVRAISVPGGINPAGLNVEESIPLPTDHIWRHTGDTVLDSVVSEAHSAPALPRQNVTSPILPTPILTDTWESLLTATTTADATSCSCHGAATSCYCHECRRCVCDTCRDSAHLVTHRTERIDDAVLHLKEKLSLNLEKMVNSQMKLMTSLQGYRHLMKETEESYKRRQEEINMQCDSLLAEVENKRSLFLVDLEQEERRRRSELEEVAEMYEKVLATSQSLGHHATSLVETGTSSAILQVAPALTDGLQNCHVDCEACCAVRGDLHLDTVTASSTSRIVDLRRQQAMLRDIHYLNPPDPPAIDVTRCARSMDTVALFLAPSRRSSDVIDTFHIHYCSEEQKTLGMEETITCRSGHNEHLANLGPTAASLSHVALLENLHQATTYYFYVAASNRAGRSADSEVVQCVTLSPRDSVVPVPVIMESRCKSYTSSIRIFTPSPHDVAPEQNISHYLLYRPRDRKSLWRAVALCGRQEHRVFGLEADAQYEFVIMAGNPRGECQLSQKLLMQTENGAS